MLLLLRSLTAPGEMPEVAAGEAVEVVDVRTYGTPSGSLIPNKSASHSHNISNLSTQQKSANSISHDEGNSKTV
jgi:hypothetical protein